MNHPFVFLTPHPALLLNLGDKGLTAHAAGFDPFLSPPPRSPSCVSDKLCWPSQTLTSLFSADASLMESCPCPATEIGSQRRNSLSPVQQLPSLPGDIPTHAQVMQHLKGQWRLPSRWHRSQKVEVWNGTFEGSMVNAQSSSNSLRQENNRRMNFFLLPQPQLLHSGPSGPSWKQKLAPNQLLDNWQLLETSTQVQAEGGFLLPLPSKHFTQPLLYIAQRSARGVFRWLGGLTPHLIYFGSSLQLCNSSPAQQR